MLDRIEFGRFEECSKANSMWRELCVRRWWVKVHVWKETGNDGQAQNTIEVTHRLWFATEQLRKVNVLAAKNAGLLRSPKQNVMRLTRSLVRYLVVASLLRVCGIYNNTTMVDCGQRLKIHKVAKVLCDRSYKLLLDLTSVFCFCFFENNFLFRANRHSVDCDRIVISVYLFITVNELVKLCVCALQSNANLKWKRTNKLWFGCRKRRVENWPGKFEAKSDKKQLFWGVFW